MPSAPVFSHRLEEAVETLRAMESDWIDRRTLEEILALSKWTAWRILKTCGAQPGPGGALSIRRTDLIRGLETLRQEGRIASETARRSRVETYLAGMARFARAKHREVARNEAAVGLVSTRFASLPPGVELTPRLLSIEFEGMEDFLQKFGAVVYALHNDHDHITEFLEGGDKV